MMRQFIKDFWNREKESIIIILLVPIIAFGLAFIDVYFLHSKDMPYIYVDNVTCVEYMRDYNGGLNPRLNRDGLPLLNEKCLKEQQ